MRVPIQLAGPTYESRSRPLSNQVTQNWYLKKPDNPATKGQLVLMPFPGLTVFGTADSPGLDRGMHVHQGALYKVTGSTLYTVDTDGTHTSVGTIPGSARCIMTGIGANIVVVTAGKAYQYNGTTVSEITDADLETPNSVAHLNNQVIYDGDNGRFCTSDVSDATSIDGLNYASAESSADDLIRVFSHGQLLYLLGEKTIETWWNSGTGNPPFDRVEQGIMQVGLGATHSVASNDDAWYLLGDDNHVYRVVGFNRARVTDDATHLTIAGFSQISDAIGMCFDLDGQRFYLLAFPSEDKTILYSEQSGWTTLVSAGARHLANSYAYFNRKNLIADRRNTGSIYELSFTTYDDAGVPIIRVRDSAPMHSGLLQKPGVLVEMNSFEVLMETGVGLLAGQGSDPKISLQVSDDGGRTWSTEMWESIGKNAEFNTKVSWHALGSFYERLVRLTISDPVFVSIHGAYAEVELGE